MPDSENFILRLRTSIWLFGMGLWLFGVSDRSIAASLDKSLTAIELMQLFTAITLAIMWTVLIPLDNNDETN